MAPKYEFNGITEIKAISSPGPYPQDYRYRDSRDPSAAFSAALSFSRLRFGKDPAMGTQKHQNRVEFLLCPPLFLPAFSGIDADAV